MANGDSSMFRVPDGIRVIRDVNLPKATMIVSDDVWTALTRAAAGGIPPVPGERVVLVQDLFGRWEVARADAPNLRWSGSAWVPLGGDVQISNLATRPEARDYAQGFGFTVRGDT